MNCCVDPDVSGWWLRFWSKASSIPPASEGGSYLVFALGLERVFNLLCFAGRVWYMDLLRVDS